MGADIKRRVPRYRAEWLWTFVVDGGEQVSSRENAVVSQAERAMVVGWLVTRLSKTGSKFDPTTKPIPLSRA